MRELEKIAKYRAVADFSKTYLSLANAVLSIIEYFSKYPTQRFVILIGHTGKKWLVLPETQYQDQHRRDTLGRFTPIYTGNFATLREIAYTFPPPFS